MDHFVPLKRICKICQIEKNLDENEFYRDKFKKFGFKLECKDCSKNKDKEKNLKNKKKNQERNKSNYLLNKDIIKQRVHDYYQNKGGKGKERDRNRNYQKQLFFLMGNQCCYCHRKTDLVIDHINDDGNLERKKLTKAALVRNLYYKKLDINNYQLLCHNCNEKKRLVAIENIIRNRDLIGKDKLCPNCELILDQAFFHHSSPYHDGLYYECVFCTSKRRKQIKQRVINLFGGRCQECNETDIDVLCIDHKDPIGKNRESHGFTLYNRILNGSYDLDKFQILCFNCNQRKHGSYLGKTENYYFSELKALEIQNQSNEELIDFELTETIIKQIDSSQASLFLDKYHYDKYGRYAKFSYGVFLNDKLIMVAKFCSPTRQGTAKTLNLDNNQVLELDRLCVHPNYHKKNFVSYILSFIIKDIKLNQKEIKSLVSFADPAYGHLGTIYKASNWIEFGKTAPSYIYKDKAGKLIKKKTLYDWMKVRGLNKDKTELEVAKSLGLNRVSTPSKIKFIYKL